MFKKILLILVVIVVLFLIFRNVEFTQSPNDGENLSGTETSFDETAENFDRKEINGEASSLTWFGENKIQAKSHTGTLRLKPELSFVGLSPKGEGDVKVLGGQFVIDMTTLEGVDEPEMLVNHLRSADFFDVETYPEANFVITGTGEAEVQGLLTIKEITKEVTVPYTIEQTGDAYTVQGTFEIDRTMWDITTLSGSVFQDIGDSVVEDTIRLSFVVTTI
jgi:hypothetical protein